MKKFVLVAIAVAGGLACGNNGSSQPGGNADASAGGDGSGGVTATGGVGTGGGAGGASTGAGGAGTGGATATGGKTGSGGVTGTGGGLGGATGATGGKTGTGGTTATTGAGGATATGGKTGAGGTLASGGTTGATGGKIGTGGITGSGGSSAAGGATAIGGSVTWSTGAPESKPTGYGQDTTGCGSGTTVTAASLAAAQAAIDAYAGSGGLCIKYTGTFNFAGITDPCTQHSLPAQILEIKRTSDITLQGADGSGANFGVHIASSSSNIIIRNMRFGLLPGGGDSDAIDVEGMSGGVPTNIWIDHNELWSSMVECAGAGDTSFDGLIDLKKGADKVTVSYNYLHDHHKVSLNGYTDDDSAIRHITYHHNVFDNVGSRTPLQRGGYSHVLNNYFHKVTTSGANIRMSGYALIEGNYFQDVKNPVTSRDSAALGFWDLRANNVTGPADFTKFGITWAASDSTPTADATDWKTTAAYPVALGYTYAVDPPDCLAAGLGSVAGAGKGLATLKCK